MTKTDAGRAGVAPSPRFEPRRHWLRWAVWDNELQRYAFQGRTWLNWHAARRYADALNILQGEHDERP